MPDGEVGVATVVVAEIAVVVHAQEVGSATVQLLHVVVAPVLDQHRRHRPVIHIRVVVCHVFLYFQLGINQSQISTFGSCLVIYCYS